MDALLNEKVKLSIQNLRDKKSRIYFLVQDTKGNAKASVRLIYQMAKTLLDSGFNPIILHEKSDYAGVVAWMDEEYMSIPHKSIEGQNLEITPEDFIVIPELFGYIMEQLKNLPCGKIVLTQNYSHIVETLQPGQNWAQYGFFKCITTSKKQQEYIENVMRQSSFDIVKPLITDSFYPKELPPMPIIGVHTKEQENTINTQDTQIGQLNKALNSKDNVINLLTLSRDSLQKVVINIPQAPKNPNKMFGIPLPSRKVMLVTGFIAGVVTTATVMK